MKVSFKRIKIKKEEQNRVKSHLILEPHRRQNPDSLMYHEDGIFSKKIFGNLYRCDCGELHKAGFCKKCEVRVVEPNNMPDFYVELCCWCSAAFADWDDAHRNEDGVWNRTIKASLDEIQDLAEYRAFIKVHSDGFDIIEVTDDLDPADYDEDLVLIGIDALKYIGVRDEWIEENMVDFLSVPHTIYRPMVISNGAPFITPINELYSKIIQRINNAVEMQEIAKDRPLYLLSFYRVISDLYHQIIESLLDEIHNVEYSILKSEIISHPITGAIRATLVNRHDVHEDIIIIGDTLVETLWPYLCKKYNGDMVKINEHLVKHDMVVLVNRPPTINHASTVAMKPRIASVYPVGQIEHTKYATLHNYKAVNATNYADQVNNYNFGDIEKYGQGFVNNTEDEDGIDTLGLRCIGMNPLMMDAMNADIDGDVLLVIALYSDDAIKEAKRILPSKSYMNYANGTIRNHIIEDFIYVDSLC